jgi:hypothetical protein
MKVRVADIKMFNNHVYGAADILEGYPELTGGGVELRTEIHNGDKVYVICEADGIIKTVLQGNAGFFYGRELQYLEKVKELS